MLKHYYFGFDIRDGTIIAIENSIVGDHMGVTIEAINNTTRMLVLCDRRIKLYDKIDNLPSPRGNVLEGALAKAKRERYVVAEILDKLPVCQGYAALHTGECYPLFNPVTYKGEGCGTQPLITEMCNTGLTALLLTTKRTV